MAEDDGFDPTELERLTRLHVRCGFYDREEVIQRLLDVFEEDMGVGRLRMHVVLAVDAAISEQRENEAAWDAFTDCDRLDLAFDNLEDVGIVARQNFTCCQTCGHAEISDEIDESEQHGVNVRGYAFYHRQDTERAVEGEGLLLAYGAIGEGKDAIESVGREIVAALEGCGLKTEWNGSLEARIGVGLDWQRRFPTQ